MLMRNLLGLILIIAGMSTAWSADEPRTGYFRKSITPLELLGADGAKAISGVFAADEKLTWQFTVPKTYDATKPAGVIVMINPHRGGGGNKAWADVLSDNNLIIVGATNAGDKSPLNERMIKAIIAREMLVRDYAIDSERYYIAGYSGGAHVAALLATGKPEQFKGAFYFGGAVFWGDKVPPKIELIRENRFAFVTGSNDVAKTTVQRIASDYKSAGIAATELIVIPNFRQKLPDSRHFARAVEFVDSR